MFSAFETKLCEHLVALALEEDLGVAGDITSKAVIPADLMGQAVFVARAKGVIAGLAAVTLVAAAVDTGLVVQSLCADGDGVEAGMRLATISGPMRSLLTAERTALNFLQRLSGVATLTRRYVDAVAGLNCLILDTRKTTPGWRHLEKSAVRYGGGTNHRFGLDDAFLIKDNHLAALAIQGRKEQIAEAVRRALDAMEAFQWIEVEVDDLEQLDAALAAGPGVVLLDNMSLDMLREAVRRRNAVAPHVKLEASGGVTLTTVRAIAETGVDCISVGALTHSAPALDIALDYES